MTTSVFTSIVPAIKQVPDLQKHTDMQTHQLANCTSPARSFKIDDYKYVYDFVLDVEHVRYAFFLLLHLVLFVSKEASKLSCCSKKNKKTTTRDAKSTVDHENVLQCTFAASGFVICGQKEGVAFPLAVYDVRKEGAGW